MIQKNVVIKNPLGLHIRPAGVLAKIATDCKSAITIILGERRINAKSVLNIMSGTIKKGDNITIICEGETEEEDLETIIDAIEKGLGENI